MPIVRVELLSGRAPELKAKAAKEITEVMTKTFGVAADQTFVIFVDVERHDWAIGGRTLSPTFVRMTFSTGSQPPAYRHTADCRRCRFLIGWGPSAIGCHD